MGIAINKSGAESVKQPNKIHIAYVFSIYTCYVVAFYVNILRLIYLLREEK